MRVAICLWISVLCSWGQFSGLRNPAWLAGTTRNAGVIWSPTNISGMQFWWTFDDFTNQQYVLTWTDRVSGIVFTNNGSSTTNDSSLGLSLLSPGFTNLAGISPASNYTFWLEGFNYTLGNNAALIMGNGSGGNFGDGFVWDKSVKKFMYYRAGSQNAFSAVIVDTATNISTSFFWANGLLYTNGVSSAESSITTPFSSSMRNMGQVPGSGRAFNAYIRHIGIWTNTLSASNVSYVWNWANTNHATNVISGLVAWWRMDDSSGSVLTDYSGNGWTGYLTNRNGYNPIWTNAQINNGLLFAGNRLTDATVTNFVVITNSATFAQTNQAITFSFWIRGQTNGAAGDKPKMIFNKGDNFYQQNDNRYPGMFVVYDDSTIATYFVQSNSASTAYIGSGQVIAPRTDGLWHHYTSVKQANGTNIIVYVDGILATLVAPSHLDVVTNWSNNASITLGGADFRPSGFSNDIILDGTLDDFRIYGRELSAIEVNALYRWGKWVKNY